MDIAIIVVFLFTAATIALIFSIWLLGRAANRAQIERHTKENYVNKLRQYYGNSGLNIYAAIGDALDRKSSWQKTMDIIFDVLDNNPYLMLEYLIECYGIDELLDALGEYEESNDPIFKKGTRTKNSSR